MENIPEFPFPEGFSIRPIRPDDIPVWADIVSEAMGREIKPDIFTLEYPDDQSEIEKRVFLITKEDGTAVGTIGAWYWTVDGRETGLIHWVAVLPAYQKYGLGKAAMSHAMKRMAELHDTCCLHTSTDHIAAIKVYLYFGFEIDMTANGADEAAKVVEAKFRDYRNGVKQ